VICANEGYFPDQVNFSGRIARVARGREGDEKVDIIKRLEQLVEDYPDLRERLGQSFARGHKEASGGIVGKKEWNELKTIMGLDDSKTKRKKLEKENGTTAATKKLPAQKNTLANYFAKA
jgi:ribosomal protein L14E/L6E/L27E